MEECRLRVFENRFPRRIFELKRDENGEWRRLYNEQLHSLYRSPNVVRAIKSKRLRWVGHVARMGGGGRRAFKILTGKPTGKRILGRIGSGEGSTVRNFIIRSPNIVTVIKCRRLRWAGHVARMGGGSRSAFKILTSKPTGI